MNRLGKHRKWGRESVVPIEGGGTIRTDLYDDNPEGASYLRVCDSQGEEVAHWSCQEWAEAPQEVIGAVIGAALSTIRGFPDE